MKFPNWMTNRTSMTDKAISEDQDYGETVWGVRAFMRWSHILDLEYSHSRWAHSPWVGHRKQARLVRFSCFYHQKTGYVRN